MVVWILFDMNVNNKRIYKILKRSYLALIPLAVIVGIYCEGKPTAEVTGTVAITLILILLPITIDYLGAYFIRPGGPIKKAFSWAFLLHYIINYLFLLLMLWMLVFSEVDATDQTSAAGMSLLMTYVLFYNSLLVFFVTFFGCWFYCLIRDALKKRAERLHR